MPNTDVSFVTTCTWYVRQPAGVVDVSSAICGEGECRREDGKDVPACQYDPLFARPTSVRTIPL